MNDEAEYTVTISAFGLSRAEEDALFDRIAEAAHALDEQVVCIGSDTAAPSPDREPEPTPSEES